MAAVTLPLPYAVVEPLGSAPAMGAALPVRATPVAPRSQRGVILPALDLRAQTNLERPKKELPVWAEFCSVRLKCLEGSIHLHEIEDKLRTGVVRVLKLLRSLVRDPHGKALCHRVFVERDPTEPLGELAGFFEIKAPEKSVDPELNSRGLHRYDIRAFPHFRQCGHDGGARAPAAAAALATTPAEPAGWIERAALGEYASRPSLVPSGFGSSAAAPVCWFGTPRRAEPLSGRGRVARRPARS